MGLVPFEFKDRQVAHKAFQHVTGGSVWELTKPACDSRSKPEYVGCPVKNGRLVEQAHGGEACAV